MTEILPRIREISEDVARAHDAFVVDLSLRGERRTQVLEVFVDTDSGITADGCAVISRNLSFQLDHENLILHRYNLVVSSPGLDRPLKFLRQYHKNVGRNLRIRFQSGEEMRTIVGKLLEVGMDSVVLKGKGTEEQVQIPFDSIRQSRVEIEFRHSSK